MGIKAILDWFFLCTFIPYYMMSNTNFSNCLKTISSKFKLSHLFNRLTKPKSIVLNRPVRAFSRVHYFRTLASDMICAM